MFKRFIVKDNIFMGKMVHKMLGKPNYKNRDMHVYMFHTRNLVHKIPEDNITKNRRI